MYLDLTEAPEHHLDIARVTRRVWVRSKNEGGNVLGGGATLGWINGMGAPASAASGVDIRRSTEY